MKKLSPTTILYILLLSFTVGSLSSCASRKYQTEWMDVRDAKHLDKIKGKRSKKELKNAHYPSKRTHK